MPCIQLDAGVVICRPGSGKLERSGITERKWCFGCREYLEHELVAFCENEPSYYEPAPRWDCPKCNRDCTAFPGVH